MQRIALYIILLFSFFSAYGQIDSTSVRSNPNACLYNHLFYLQSDSYDPAQSALSLPDNIENREELAIQLKQILDGKGIYVDINRVTSLSNYRDTVHNENIYLIDKSEQKIYLELSDSGWTYSRTTIELIPELHKKLYPFGTKFITKFDAPVWQTKLLGVNLWKIFGLLIILLLSYVVFYVSRKISEWFIKSFLRRRMEITERINNALLSLSRIVGFLLSIRFILFFLPMFQFSSKLNATFIKSLNILSLFFIVISFNYILKILFVYLEKLTIKTENTLDDQLLPVLNKLASLLLWSFGVVYILDYVGVNVTALLAGISIGGLALALAAQDTVKNFFGSIMIFLDKPFQIGDLIEFNGVLGSVEEVGIRSTRIRTVKNSLTYVPNALLADSVINNLGLRVYRRFNTTLGITYDSSPESIEKFVDGIRQIIEMHPKTVNDNYEVHLNSFADSSLNILVNIFFDTQIWSDELKYRHEIMIAMIKLSEALGIRFAFPTQTLHIEEMPQAGSLTPASKNSDELSQNMTGSLSDIKDYFSKKA